jgi:cell division protein FtsI (penicillin-binding protein 3)
MKPFAVALALEKGIVKPETIIQTAPGSINITGSTITDTHPYGALTVNEVMQKSSNVGTVKIAMQLQPREMWEMFTAVGLGQKPQLPFPGVVSGRLRAAKTWRPIEQATMSYGYGVSTSLFQMARAYTIFATDGKVMPATLMKSSASRCARDQSRKCTSRSPHVEHGSRPWRDRPKSADHGVFGRRENGHSSQARGQRLRR